MRIPVLVLLGVATVFLWWVLWPALAVTAGMVFVAAVTGFTVRLLGSSWRVLTSRHTDGPSPAPPDSDEPAFSRYLVTQVWRDHLAVLADTLSTASRPAMLLGAGATKALLGGWQAFALAPLWLVVAAGLLTGAVGCLVVMALVFAGQAATVAVAGGAQLLGVAAVRGLDGLLVSVRRTRPACPHPGCYRSFTRPEHACSRCGAAHRKLAAGRHGVLRRVCRCGALLPTSVLLGRNRLHAACPHCHRPLPGSIGHAPLVHLPIVGGPAAGKSTYTHLAVGALRQHAGRVRFADPDEAEAFASRLAALRAGKEAPRTPVELPQATTLDVELTGAGRCLMYLFDPPGEHYTSADRIGWQRYLDHADTLLLVVDPLSLEGVRRSLTATETRALSDVTSSAEDPAHVIDRLVGALRTRPDGGKLDRVAVVVTKIDAIRRTTVGQPLANGFGPGSVPGDQVRDWLNWVGWGNPMRTLDRTAREVNYFGSGLDLPDALLLEPVRWLAEGSLTGRHGWGFAQPQLDPSAGPLAWMPAGGADEIPRQHRILRRTLLVQTWALAVAGMAGMFSLAGLAFWNLFATTL